MVTWGISALSHDAALAVLDGDRVLFAAHAERYSRRKNDGDLNAGIVAEARGFGEPQAVVWYEKPLLKKTRHLYAGQYREACDPTDLPRRRLRQLGVTGCSFRTVGHHDAHAAAGFYTSPFDRACVLTTDAIGEWDCTTVRSYGPTGHRLLRRRRYPHSLGLLYSAFTRRCGFKPNEEEYILMGLAALGEPRHTRQIRETFLEYGDGDYRLRVNVHRGIGNWLPDAQPQDLAASIQAVTEEVLVDLARWARRASGETNLVLMGGVALNCVANTRIARDAGFDEVFIFPNPGDAGSAIGAAAAVLRRPLRWPGPYLGTAVDRPYPVRAVADALEAGQVVGVANGRAEFGPRALGNRSLLCDPRGAHVKDKVNTIKGREPFRPFAPAVLEEAAHDYFDLPVRRSPYMQFTAPCRYPREFPAITHHDGTSRVQTVSRADNPGFYSLIEEFHRRTGCPMVLNTSLNVKGEPLVNTAADGARFAELNGVEVF